MKIFCLPPVPRPPLPTIKILSIRPLTPEPLIKRKHRLRNAGYNTVGDVYLKISLKILLEI